MTDTTFGPDKNVTRAEIAVMLLRTLKNVMPEIKTEAEFKQKFFYEKEIPGWGLEAVGFFNLKDVFNGANGYILPKANINREQGIVLVKRVYDKFFGI